MPLSSNSIFHFSSEKSSLLGILSDNFRVHYCTEQYDLKEFEIAAKVPMVSFCDIPLSEIKEHIGKYGAYGIGLTKEWAIRKQLSPILYIEPGSSLSHSLGIAIDGFLDLNKEIGTPMSPAQLALLDIFRYVKNYQGQLVRKTMTSENYRFSDEREWRYVPPKEDDSHRMLLGKEIYEEDPNKFDASLIELRLTFEPNDIKYIIIQDDSEIAEFVNHLRSAKGKNYTYHEIERLTTRLITAEQIRTDF